MATGMSGLVVADVDLKKGKDGFSALAERGNRLSPTFHYGTPSGGEHWIYRGAADVPPTVDLDGMIGVDRRSGGSYIVWAADNVPPSAESFSEDAPEWLLTTRGNEATTHAGFGGPIEEWLDTLVDGEPSGRVQRFVLDIPADNFNHQDVVEITWQLVRLGAEREPGVRQALDALYAKWVKPPYDDVQYRRELDTALKGAIRKAGAPEEPLPDLLSAVDAMNALPEFTTTGTEFLSMLTEEPVDKSIASFADARAVLIRDVLAAGLDERHAFTVTWNAVVGHPLHEEVDGQRHLWREVQAIIATQQAPGAPLAAVTPIRRTTGHLNGASLLTEPERAYLAEQGRWFGDEYVEWAQHRVDIGAPYNRMNRWAILSMVFSPTAAVFPDGIRMDLNLFMMLLGKSSTGKTKTKNLLREFITAYYPSDRTPNIGGDLSKEALTKLLIQRDGEVSWLHRDDVDGLLKEIQGTKMGSWNEGLIQRWCDFYEGRVDPIYRQGDKEHSGVEAHCLLVAHFVGVQSEVIEVSDAKLWTSGLYPRFVFTFGDPPQKRQGRRLNLARGDVAHEGDPQVKQWAAEFAAARHTLEGLGRLPLAVGMSDDANDRFAEFDERLMQLSEGHQHEDRLEAVRNRFTSTILKCAALVALSEGEATIQLRHLLVALQQAEEWWGNALQMVSDTAETQFDRQTMEVENMIRNHNGILPEAQIFTAFKPQETAERILRQLVAEERIVREVARSGSKSARLLKREGRVAA